MFQRPVNMGKNNRIEQKLDQLDINSEKITPAAKDKRNI